MEFIVEKNNCSNIDELIDLSKTYYSEGDIVNKLYLNWQYLNNPSGIPYLLTSREITTNELAGQYLVLPIKFNLANTDVNGSLSLNTLTSPKYQGKGLFTKMARATYKECADSNALFTIGFPNPNSYPGFVRNLEFKHLGDIPLLVKPLRMLNMAFSLLQKKNQKHGGDIKMKSLNAKNSKIKEFEFNEEGIGIKYDKFWNIIKKQYKLSVNKDFTYLKWRYETLPTRDYKLFYFEDNGEIVGLVILRAEHVWGFDVGLIMDLLVIDGYAKISKILLSYAKNVFKKSKIDFIAALHSKTYEYDLFKKSYFLKIPQCFLPQKIHFIVRLNKEFTNSEMLFKSKNWKLTFGDYDVF